MADIRIKDLATTATTTASDDFMAVDGTTNGTRKLSAATPAFLTSVTTPSLTSPASTNLTLGLGTGGTALTLTSSTLAATFAGEVTATGNAFANGSYTVVGGTAGAFANAALTINNRSGANDLSVIALGYRPDGTKLNGAAYMGYVGTNASGNGLGDLIFGTRSVTTDTAPTERLRIASTGTVTISSSTAGSSGVGALVVTGGLSAGNNGNASYFGGAVTGADNIRSKYGTLASPGIQVGDENAGMFVSNGYLKFKGGASGGIVFRNAADTTDVFYVLNNGNMNTTGAATFAGAVTMAAWPIIGNDGNATYILQSAATITAYTAGASVGTLTNAPSAGNPTKWITINDNGTLRRIPTWN